jgi:hypothetical protein
MAVVTKKTVKTKQSKPTKRAAVAAPVVDAPVLFRLPDLTLQPLPPTALASIQFEVGAAPSLSGAFVPPAPRIEPEKISGKIPTASAPLPTAVRPNLMKRSLRLVDRWGRPAGKRVEQVARRVLRLPFIAPGGLLCASLLLALGLIYAPWNRDKKPVAQASGNVEKGEQTVKGEHSPGIEEGPGRHDAARAAPETDEKLPLKKIATQLDEQLSAEDDAEKSIDAESAAAQPTANKSVEDESFTEPWWRKKPAHETLVAEDSDVEKSDRALHADEDQEVVVDNEDYTPPKRTALRKRQVEEPADEIVENESRKPSRSRFSQDEEAEDIQPEDVDRQLGSKLGLPADLEENSEESETPVSPWKRIRNERLEREPVREERLRAESGRDEPVTQKQTKKPQYRSPPGQEFDLVDELPTETAARPRGDTKRNGVR